MELLNETYETDMKGTCLTTFDERQGWKVTCKDEKIQPYVMAMKEESMVH